MPDANDSNALWLAISEYGEGNLFSVYPKLLAELLLHDEATRIEGDTSEAERLVLPSDKEYRLQQYFMLVSMQKVLDTDEEEASTSNEEKHEEYSVEEWAPWNLVLPTKNPNAPPPVAVRTTPGPAWDIKQVLKAGRLLFKPPMPVEFADEQEMRYVYSIIYDVFRYKTILDQALNDVTFFTDYPAFIIHRQPTWLFIMELARRRWAARPRGEQEAINQLLEEAGPPFQEIEKAVWDQRVHFAAAIARIRIKNKAFTLVELLPPHLREERVSSCVHKQTITGWVNTFKTKKIASLVKRLHELGYSYSSSRMLCAGEYRFDRVCPRFITLRSLPDTSIGQLDLVKEGIIVVQEREFCEGASTLCRVLRANELRGVVAQTHASSPRCSAYLAAQLRELAAVLRAKTPAAPAIPELGKLIVFGAGDKVESYVQSLKLLGIDASVAAAGQTDDKPLVSVYSEPVYCDTPTVTNALDGVVAVLATPPNSYSAVNDPIDLVCGRGGDLAMLEVLTESEIDSAGKDRVQLILEEQKKTLKALLSKPQIQLILYETHSALEAENQAQVTRAVAEANRLARERHSLLKKKPRDQVPSAKLKEAPEESLERIPSIDNTISRSDLSSNSESDVTKIDSEDAPCAKKIKPMSSDTDNFVLKKNLETSEKVSRPKSPKARPIPDVTVTETDDSVPRDPDRDNPDVVVPNCDLYEIGKLPILGNGLDINYILDRDGCYLGLIQRKQITRLDAKFMIDVAEERGLFGGGAMAAAPARRKKEPAASSAPRRRRRKTSGFEVERVAAPTYASLVRSRRGSAPAPLPLGVNVTGTEEHVCERHARRQAAASAYSSAACTCDAKHRAAQNRRRASADQPGETVSSPRTGCRRPFPLAVHDLKLHTMRVHHKVYVS